MEERTFIEILAFQDRHPPPQDECKFDTNKEKKNYDIEIIRQHKKKKETNKILTIRQDIRK